MSAIRSGAGVLIYCTITQVRHWPTFQYGQNMADSRLAPRQWGTSLQGNAVSHLLGANLEAAMKILLVYILVLDDFT